MPISPKWRYHCPQLTFTIVAAAYRRRSAGVAAAKAPFVFAPGCRQDRQSQLTLMTTTTIMALSVFSK